MRDDAFAAWLTTQDLADTTRFMGVNALRRVERAYTIDLDEAYDSDGLDALMDSLSYSTEDARRGRSNPSKLNMGSGEIRTQLAWYRSHLNSYRNFRQCLDGGDATAADIAGGRDDDASGDGAVFGLEADLETALRGSLDQLEPGLTPADGGHQRRVEAGFIDILARDANGLPVVIELKAGTTRPEAVSQILGYMACIGEEEGTDVRGILVGAGHSTRVRFAAKAVPNLALRSYSYRFEFL
ncbi:endonuclease NucS domain-containing protein [Wenxinia saemankumensis]|uniref:Endonuclease NucS C-terminal domain-containing protein n=1 Tax=Wenxinia saemankumensis TaxID=1447782 RepID=A0A1M6CVU8_9RHOB|nr:endonuclease NucS domain-containing protein [Wenxinia saemankumensis]SHI65205.1 Protein of unknown function DUF91 [Wenxinia saemankumensis]